MKRLILAAIILLAGKISFSQVKFGIMGGYHQSTITEKNNLPDWKSNVEPYYSNQSTFHLGFTTRFPFNEKGNWFFQPSVLFFNKGRKFNRVNDEATSMATDTAMYSYDLRTRYIEMPFNLTGRFPFTADKKAAFLISAGPSISFFFNGTEKDELQSYSTGNFVNEEKELETGNRPFSYKTYDVGVNARAGFEIGNVSITGFISQGLTNIYKAPYDGTFKNRTYGASLGIWLYNHKEEPRIKDRDKDGIVDEKDDCPDVAGPEITHGCPDSDGDGVADIEDKCPELAGMAKYDGCPPPDTDGDSINDEEDRCPAIPGVARYNGCPVPDRDSDGVSDDDDACPDVVGYGRYKGCPVPDTDKDGVNDEEDKCPDEPGLASNQGCPEIKKEIVEKVTEAARNVYFDFGKSTIRKNSYKVLDEIVTILKQNPKYRLAIEGHTDNIGSAERNKIVSQQRADAIRNYLADKGVEPGRLTATGFGFDVPVADNATEEGRAKNRRVEMKISY